MKTERVFLTVSTLLILCACVSTSTGPKKPKADDAAAAIQYYELGARYYRNGNYEFARDRLEHALQFDPKMAIAHATLALTYIGLENPRLATEHYDLAVRYEPDNFDVRNGYAVYLCQQRRFDEAQVQFDRAISVYTNDNPEVMLTNAGVCMSAKPDYEKAEQYFRDALDRKPRYGEALIQLASLKYKTEDFLHARAFVQRYIETNPPSPSALFLAVQIENKLGDERSSTDYSNRLLAEFPDSPEAKYLRESSN